MTDDFPLAPALAFLCVVSLVGGGLICWISYKMARLDKRLDERMSALSNQHGRSSNHDES